MEDAFQDETTNHDYFGSQSRDPPSENPLENSEQSVDFHLSSVEIISEVKSTNLSPLMRYQASRESSRPSTPSDSSSHHRTTNYRPNQRASLSSSSRNYELSSENSITDLNQGFANLNVTNHSDMDDLPAPFTPDAIRIKIKHRETDNSSLPSSQFKLILPQYFLVKYLGRTKCTQIWGSTAVRAPIDEMVNSARQLSSVNEMPTLEACVNMRGLTLTHRYSPAQDKHSNNHNFEPYQCGLIPLEYISYVMHDTKYSKISACIILRQPKMSSSEKKTSKETTTECYAFLFQSKDHAHRFALSLSEAFQSQRNSFKGAKQQNQDNKRDGRSPQRRLKHKSSHHHERARNKYDDSYLRDSEV